MGVTEQPQGSLGVTTILDVTGTPGLGDGRVGSGRAQLGPGDPVRGSLITVIFVIAQHSELPLLASLSPE